MSEEQHESGGEPQDEGRIGFNPAGIAIGMGAGIAIGAGVDNLAVGIAIGAGAGILFALALGQTGRTNSRDE